MKKMICISMSMTPSCTTWYEFVASLTGLIPSRLPWPHFL